MYNAKKLVLFAETLLRYVDKGNNETSVIIANELQCAPDEAVAHLYSLVAEAEEEVHLTGLDDDVVRRNITIVRQFRAAFISAFGCRAFSDFKSRLSQREWGILLSGVSDLVSARVAPDQAIDRQGFLSDTRVLIQKMTASDLPDYAKSVLVLKLNAVSAILLDSEIYSDADIRRRVKSIVADFSVEFHMHDRRYYSIYETLLGWAKPVMRVGVFALALTADTSAVVAYLQPPVPQLPAPSSEGE